jgi:hypothetical protein
MSTTVSVTFQSPTPSQQVQQQMTLMAASAAQSGAGYINPMAALAASQVHNVQQVAPNGMSTNALTPTTGTLCYISYVKYLKKTVIKKLRNV